MSDERGAPASLDTDRAAPDRPTSPVAGPVNSAPAGSGAPGAAHGETPADPHSETSESHSGTPARPHGEASAAPNGKTVAEGDADHRPALDPLRGEPAEGPAAEGTPPGSAAGESVRRSVAGGATQRPATGAGGRLEPGRRGDRDRGRDSRGPARQRPDGSSSPRGRRRDKDPGGDGRERVPAPALPEDLASVQLDAEVRRDLRGLRKDVADEVSQHLVAAGSLLEDDPERALGHARYARSKASRLAVVREAAGLAAYHAGEWAEAIAELRAARRMGGGPGHLAVLADAERALGRPERALDIARGPEARDLDRAEQIELLIVASGARRDLGEPDAAVVSLQIAELDPKQREPCSARLFYAYADALLAAGRRDEAVRWFLAAADADDDELTDAAERLEELTDTAERLGDSAAEPDPAHTGGSVS